MCGCRGCRSGKRRVVSRAERPPELCATRLRCRPGYMKRIDARSNLYRGERTVLEWRPVESHCNPRTLKISVFLAAPTRHTTTRETRDGVAAARRRCRRGKGRHAAPQSGTPQRRCPFPVCPRPADLLLRIYGWTERQHSAQQPSQKLVCCVRRLLCEAPGRCRVWSERKERGPSPWTALAPYSDSCDT